MILRKHVPKTLFATFIKTVDVLKIWAQVNSLSNFPIFNISIFIDGACPISHLKINTYSRSIAFTRAII
jgi:hypothetical protein